MSKTILYRVGALTALAFIFIAVPLGAGLRADVNGEAARLALATEKRALDQTPDERLRTHAGFRQAIAQFSDALGCPGGDPAARAKLHAGRGLMYHLLDRDIDAVRDYTAAIELEPDNDNHYERRGVSSVFLDDFEQGVKDFSKAMRLNRRFEVVYTGRRAFTHFLAGDFAAAELDFATAFELGDTRIYMPIWRHIAAERSGVDDIGNLRAYDGYDPAEWPSPVIALFLGQMSADDVMARARDENPIIARQMRSEGLFYIGQYYLLEGKRDEAVEAFREILELGDRFFVEYRGALLELERMGVN